MASGNGKRVFISYSWEPAANKKWVKRFAQRLVKDSVNVRLDQWHYDPRQLLPDFMNSEIRKADTILVVCTPEYQRKVHAREDDGASSCVAWETMLISSTMLINHPNKIIVVISRGRKKDSVPLFLQGYPFFDLTSPETFEDQYKNLLRVLLNVRDRPPAPGVVPAGLEFETTSPLSADTWDESNDKITLFTPPALDGDASFFQIIQRENICVDIRNRLLARTPVVNLVGPSGHGKSNIFYMLRLQLRTSDKFIDCFLPPIRNRTEEGIYKTILARIGGKDHSQPSLSPITTVWSVLENYLGNGRRTVFLIDDAHDYEGDFFCELLDLLLRFPEAAVVFSSRNELNDNLFRPLNPQRVNIIHVPVFTLDEAMEFLRPQLTRYKYSDDHCGLIRDNLASEKSRHPVVLRELLLQLPHDPSNDLLVQNIQEVIYGVEESIDKEVKSIFERAGAPPELRANLLAPETLDSDIVTFLLSKGGSQTVKPNCVSELLRLLYTFGFLKKFGQLYWWEGYYREALLRHHNPPTNAFCRLVAREIECRPLDLISATRALHYLEHTLWTHGRQRRIATQILEILSHDLPVEVTIPAVPQIEHWIGELGQGDNRVLLLLHVRYLECRGDYKSAWQYLQSAKGESQQDDEQNLMTYRILDKIGRFDDLRQAILERVRSRGLVDTPTVKWGDMDLYYWGRYHQAGGSLAEAQHAYALIEELEDPSLVHRVRALIQCATIYVFSEEPQLAIPLLTKAHDIATDDSFLREQADILRYQARATKQRVILRGDEEWTEGLKEAERLTGECLKISIKLNYMEGQIWATVLEGRIAYFQKLFGKSYEAFQRAHNMIESAHYKGAVPHLYRHWALAYSADGRADDAAECLQCARSVAERTGRRYVLALIYDTEAKVAMLAGHTEIANKYIGEAQELYRGLGLFSPPFTALKKRLEEALDDPSVLLSDGLAW